MKIELTLEEAELIRKMLLERKTLLVYAYENADWSGLISAAEKEIEKTNRVLDALTEKGD